MFEEGMPGIDACQRPKEHTFLYINDTRLSKIIAKQGFGNEIFENQLQCYSFTLKNGLHQKFLYSFEIQNVNMPRHSQYAHVCLCLSFFRYIKMC